MLPSRMIVLLHFGAGALLGLGCGGQPQTAGTESKPMIGPTIEPSLPSLRDEAPKPDLARMVFEPETRTLTLYELPDRMGRWMISTPMTKAGTPIDRVYQFPADMDLDLDAVAVFYTVPNRRPSPSVTLRELHDSGNASLR